MSISDPLYYKGDHIMVKRVKYIFIIMFLTLLVIHLTTELKYAFEIIMALVVVQIIAYSIAEKIDKKRRN